MLKCKTVIFILLTVVLVSAQAYGQQEIKNQQIRTASGKITKVDVESGVIDVKTDDGAMTLHLSSESDLKMSTHPMSIIEIEQGDPVMFQYIYSSGQNNVINLVDNKSAG